MTAEWRIVQQVNFLRDNIGLSYDEPIGNIDDLVREAGYEYVEESFNDDFSGFSKSLGGGNYLIGFNSDHFWNESFRRFTISHELGHLSLPEHRIILDRTIMHRSKPEFSSADGIEKEADLFAINLLAPKITLLKIAKHKKFSAETIRNVADYFQISLYAAALRFIETTDLCCSLVVCNKNGYIEFEKRSQKLQSSLRHSYLYRQKINPATFTFNHIQGDSNTESATTSLNDWYQNLPVDIKTDESVLDLTYNNKVLVLLEPHVSNIDEYIREQKYYE